MTPAAIHQITAGFTGRDAISNEARELRRLFRRWGHASDIFSDPAHLPHELRGDALGIDELRPTGADIVILHLSVGSPVNEHFASLPGRKVILYHNITPPEFFGGVNPDLARNLAAGREQTRALATVADRVLADSRFNASELEAMGYRNVEVFPLLINFGDLTDDVDEATLRLYRDGGPTVLFVGRCAPNKAIDDILRAFTVFQRELEPNARLLHVGSWAGTEMYHGSLIAQAREQALSGVELLGTQPQDRLNAMYASADVFVCMSEHEGFCIPLLEAMIHDVPVLAYAAGAVEETLDGAGVLFREKNWHVIAEVMQRLIRDLSLRESVLATQRQRVARYRDRDPEAELQTLLGSWIS